MSLDRALVEEVALNLGISEAFVEKDWHVTQVIKILVENPYPDFSVVFTGGTSLSKAHKLIERFSEDIDFRIITPSLQGQGRSQVRRALSAIKEHVTGLLAQTYDVRKVDARDDNRHIMIDLAYPTVSEPAQPLRPHIKLELTLADLQLPSIDLPVSSFINQVAGRAPEVNRIACINPVENAADKLSALIWRIPSRVRGDNDRQPDVVRHLHDLAKLSEMALNAPAFAALVKGTVAQDANRAQTLQGLSTSEKLSRMLTILQSDLVYREEYERFVNGMSYAQDAIVPSYDEALTKVKLLSDQVKLDL